MSAPVPLAAAAERLRGKPGRPKKTAEETKAECAERRLARRAAQLVAVTPRLLNLEGSARYLGGLSKWSVLDLIANGTIQRVVIPGANGKDLRRVLLDREQLDELVLLWRESAR